MEDCGNDESEMQSDSTSNTDNQVVDGSSQSKDNENSNSQDASKIQVQNKSVEINENELSGGNDESANGDTDTVRQRKSSRSRSKPKWMQDFVEGCDEEIMITQDVDMSSAKQVELDSWNDNDVFEEVQYTGQKLISTK
ncbi:hypothetical protein HOLleu_20073 [Holothuria leucospilota]|uniref:Uncharacterized protein n=1 Tax=Holothuria leucospilota TaxID=206669 RepID=A0A9Q1H7Q3_HOLLE|nr:hypothetical protein HOLleu_20073 [Holothuria leucospilota]